MCVCYILSIYPSGIHKLGSPRALEPGQVLTQDQDVPVLPPEDPIEVGNGGFITIHMGFNWVLQGISVGFVGI